MQTETLTPFNVFATPDAIKAGEKPFDIRLGVKVEKVDKEKRLVRGRATAEILDAHGEVVDYESAKKAFATWKGNIREMHQPIAVGKAVDVECVDATKEIFVTAYVSKGAPQTWEKVLDETLSEFSIGARAIAKTEKLGDKPVTKLYLTRVNETSLVDAGACPGSSFEIVKMEGGQPVMAQELTDEERSADAEPVATDTVAPAPDAGADSTTATDAPAEKTLCVVSSLADVLALLATSPTERVQKFDALTLGADVQKRMEGYDIRIALQTIAGLEELLSSEVYESERAEYAMGAEHVPDPENAAQIEMLRNAAELVLGYLISEFMAQFGEAPAAADGATEAAKSVTVAKRARAAAVLPNLTVLLEKVGRRHSKTDEQMLKSIHDHAVALGAECAAEKLESKGGDSAQPDAPHSPETSAAAVVPEAADSAVAKLLTETTDTLKQAQDTIRAQAESMSALQARVETLEAQPMPGGPVTRAVAGTPVQKSIGSLDEQLEGVDPAEVIKVLQSLAEQAPTEAERRVIAEKVIAVSMRSGLGRSVVTRLGEQ